MGAFDDLYESNTTGGGAFADLAPKKAREPNSLARQAGLAVRYGVEGLANAAQLGTEPIRYVTDRLTGQTGKTKPLGALATDFADRIGLPSPQDGTERIIGDASRLVAGAGGMAGGAGALGRSTTGAAQSLLQGLAANPVQQLTSAAGAGLAGGQARENGAGAGAQAVSALLGGVGGGLLPGAVSGVANTVRDAANRTINRLTPAQLDARISDVLTGQGVEFGQLNSAAQNALRRQMGDALSTGKEIDPTAVRRLADFASVGATPTRGMVSQNPVQITREMNLAKTAAASSDDTLSGLPMIQNRNNSTLIARLNDAGAGRGDPLKAGEALSGAVIGRRDALRSAEQQAWDAAKGMPGYTQPIEKGVLSQINGALDSEGLMPFMNKTISDYMGAFQGGNRPFTPQDYRNLQSMLSREMSKGGNEAAAAGVAARVLNASDLKAINPAGHITTPVPAGMAARIDEYLSQPRQAIDAVNQARGATRAAYQFEGSSPLVRQVLGDGRAADPEKIASSYIIGGTLNEAREVADHVGKSPAIKNAIVTHLKDRALSSQADEVGKFSQSAYNKALEAIGDQKLALFFNKEELAQLRAVGRVASYMQNQPVGSAVNNSNSATTLLGKGMDLLNGVASRVPFGRAAIVDPMRQLNIDIASRQAQNVGPGLLAPIPRQRVAPGLLAPAAAYGGLLAAPN